MSRVRHIVLIILFCLIFVDANILKYWNTLFLSDWKSSNNAIKFNASTIFFINFKHNIMRE